MLPWRPRVSGYNREPALYTLHPHVSRVFPVCGVTTFLWREQEVSTLTAFIPTVLGASKAGVHHITQTPS